MNKIWIIALLIPMLSWSQRFEKQSYPRSFNISKTHVSAKKSTPGTYYIRPTDELISKKVEARFSEWLKVRGQATSDEKKQKLAQLEQEVCFQIAQEEIKRSKGYSYVNQQRLTIIVCKPGFNTIELDVPLVEIEPFLEHYNRLSFKVSNVKFAKDQTFICQQVEIQVPGTNKTYLCEMGANAFDEVANFPFNFEHLTN